MARRKTKDKLKISNKNINHININLGNKSKGKNKKTNGKAIQKPLLNSNPILSHIPHLFVERQDPTIGNKLMNLENQANMRLLGNIDDPRINYLENRLNNGENAFNRLLTNSLIFKSNNNPQPIIEEPPNKRTITSKIKINKPKPEKSENENEIPPKRKPGRPKKEEAEQGKKGEIIIDKEIISPGVAYNSVYDDTPITKQMFEDSYNRRDSDLFDNVINHLESKFSTQMPEVNPKLTKTSGNISKIPKRQTKISEIYNTPISDKSGYFSSPES